MAGASENHGIEQERLNQVFGARVIITALRARNGPGLEFLEYVAPPGGHPLPDDAKPNDLLFWVTHVALEDTQQFLEVAKPRLVSRPPSQTGEFKPIIVRDPDGHALKLIPAPHPLSATR